MNNMKDEDKNQAVWDIWHKTQSLKNSYGKNINSLLRELAGALNHSSGRAGDNQSINAAILIFEAFSDWIDGKEQITQSPIVLIEKAYDEFEILSD